MRNGNYKEADLLAYRHEMPINDDSILIAGEVVVDLDVETIWDVLFDDSGNQPWDAAKASLEHELRRLDKWEQPKLKSFRDRPVLAQRSTLFESTFNWNSSRFVAMSPFFLEH